MDYILAKLRTESEFTIKNVVLDFMSQNKNYIYCYLFLSLGVPITNIYLPHLYGKLVSLINSKGTIDNEIKLNFLLIIAIWLFVNFLWFLMNQVNSKFLPRLRTYMRKYVVDRVIDIYKENYTENELGGIMANLVRLPDEVDKFFYSIIDKVLPVTYTIVGSILYFTWINPTLGLVSAATIGGLSLWTLNMVNRCYNVNKTLSQSHEQLYGKINDSLGNLLNVYTSNQDAQEKQYIDNYQQEYTDTQRLAFSCSGNFLIQTNISYLLLFTLLNFLTFYMFSQNKMPLSAVISVMIVTLELISKMVSVIGIVNKMMVETSIIGHVQESLDKMAAIAPTSKPTQSGSDYIPDYDPDWTGDGDIHFNDVTLEYSVPISEKGDPASFSNSDPTSDSVSTSKYSKKRVLNGVNLEIRRGQTVVLVGQIGSGKTSLSNSLLRLTPYSGEITIGGRDIRTLSLTQLRDNVLYVPQNPRLFDRTVYENISYGNNVSKEQVAKTLAEYGIKLDLEKSVGKFGQKLSGGQRQMVCILRTLFKNAPIIVLDEPTASLDYSTKNDVMELLKVLLKNRTVIIVTHDKDVIQYADTIVTMRDGKVV